MFYRQLVLGCLKNEGGYAGNLTSHIRCKLNPWELAHIRHCIEHPAPGNIHLHLLHTMADMGNRDFRVCVYRKSRNVLECHFRHLSILAFCLDAD